MGAYILRRAVLSVFVLWAAVSIVFLVLRLLPADPALLILGSSPTPEQLAAVRAAMGLDQPLIVQYGSFLADAVRLDFGDSYRFSDDAMGLVMQRLPATLELSGVGLLFSLLVGIPFGIIAALKVNKLPDRIVSTFSLATQSLPTFWVGIIFILVFARGLQILPSGGTGSIAHLILPAVTLAMPFLAILTRMTRNSLLEVIHEGYIQTARSKGLNERIVIFPHAIRNALIPIVTIVGLQFGILMAGSVVVETVFAWPGVGRLLIDSINQRDYNLVQAIVLVIATVFVAINFIVDLLYGYLDPRVRLTK